MNSLLFSNSLDENRESLQFKGRRREFDRTIYRKIHEGCELLWSLPFEGKKKGKIFQMGSVMERKDKKTKQNKNKK